jgi:hypothetical protein
MTAEPWREILPPDAAAMLAIASWAIGRIEPEALQRGLREVGADRDRRRVLEAAIDLRAALDER